ncbi:MAG TPA: helix-turn-helix domain-containing protein [Acidimicrobiales bacterium]
MAGRVREGMATRAKIIAEAERLFGERGIDRTSTRDLARAAGVNQAATYYHFGSKKELVRAILRMRADEVRARRRKLLEAIGHPDPSAREIAEAMVRATYDMGEAYMRFIVAACDNPVYLRLATEEFRDASIELLESAKSALAHLPADVAVLRFGAAQVLTNQLLGRWRNWLEPWARELHPSNGTDYIEFLIDFIAGALSSPHEERMTGSGGADAVDPAGTERTRPRRAKAALRPRR